MTLVAKMKKIQLKISDVKFKIELDQKLLKTHKSTLESVKQNHEWDDRVYQIRLQKDHIRELSQMIQKDFMDLDRLQRKLEVLRGTVANSPLELFMLESVKGLSVFSNYFVKIFEIWDIIPSKFQIILSYILVFFSTFLSMYRVYGLLKRFFGKFCYEIKKS